MKRNILLRIVFLFTLFYQGSKAQQGQAQNPIIFADVPDMSIVRAGNNYYMSSTTMHMNPGVPIMKSTDLVNWKLVNYAYDTLANIDELNLNKGKSTYGRGSWASCLRYHKGIYYVTTFAQTTGKTYIFSTKNIEKGPWKVSSFQPSYHDHTLFFDDDGRIYFIYSAGKLKLVELNADASGVKPGTKEQVIIENASAPAGTNIMLQAEGSQLFKVKGKYYLFNIVWPRDGMRTVLIHRADKITGPWEGRVALQDLGVAQGGLIDTPDGNWYAYLFRDYGAVGRIPYLVPVKWVDGWPVLGVDGKVPETISLPAGKGLIPGIVASDEFTRKKGDRTLPLVWQWNHNPDNKHWSLNEREGYLRITTSRVDTSFYLVKNLLTQRTIGPACTGSTKIDVSNMKEGDFAGLALFQKRYGQVGVKFENGVKSIVMISAESEKPVEIQRIPLSENTVYLKADCDFRDKVDIATFYYSLDGKKWKTIGSPMHMSYTLPHFMGYRYGLFNYASKTSGGVVDFDFFHIALAPGWRESGEYSISSPDKKIVVTCNPQKAVYRVSYKGQSLLMDSKLGVIREDDDFSKGLKVLRVSAPVQVKENYSMLTAKKKNITYTATETVIETSTGLGKKMNIIFRVSNDGVAFRYEFPDSSVDIKKIISEETSFHFQAGTKGWLQPKAEAQSGFEHSNPSYEAHYMMNIEAGTPSPTKNGWVYPALFRYKDVWMLITEAALGRTYCGTALKQNSPDREYKIGFPQAPEVFSKGTLNPESTLPWRTPWRIIVLGDIKTIAESTLGTDLALPAVKMDTSFIAPGKSSWSWILKKDDSTVFNVQKKYVDFAADMKWQYCLLDATWDVLMGYDSVRILAEYARKKNVGLLLWYNSAGDWNTVKFTPRDKLLTHESRMKEFARLHEMGIKGLKIDFFSGDGQSMINYYQDILEDAAANQLLVNFHGATLPRGLHRTYPNLMTMEAVFGYEMITFGQESANKAPEHSVMSALVRNAFDPMDFTPMNLYKIPNIKRVTTAAFELATSVIFLSGIQHYAESPEGMAQVPEVVKTFLRQLPNSWDDVKFIDGYPGKLYVVARKSGNKWYVAGINGEGAEKSLKLDLSFLKNNQGQLIASRDGTNEEPSFNSTNFIVPASGQATINVKGHDGFVIIFDQFPYQNAQLSSEERAKDLISRLTLAEKAALMCDVSEAIPSLGIKKFNWWSEALHGLANNNNVTVFPEPIGMAASFNDELVYKIFNATSDEVRARYHESVRNGKENTRFLSLSVWTPNVNIFRDPRWGRGQETYGEDPYLTSRMGVSVVKGLQGPADAKYKKLLACAKHYAVHSGPEWSRHELNLNNVDPRDLWETYLPAFKALVQDADVRQVMCAYQRLDDEPCCSNTRLLQNILREQWGFKYLVVSDCGAIGDFYTSHKVSSNATHAAARGVLAGTDVECQWDNHNYKLLPQAVEKGLISENEIDQRLIRVLIGRFDLGEMDKDELVPWTKIPASVINNEAHRKLALDISLESMTLLQNNDILPLKKSIKKIAVIGPNANDKPMLWGNYNGTPVRTITILDGMTSKLSAGKILYDKGCDLVENKVTESYFSNCSMDGKKGFKATYWNSSDRSGGVIATQEITNPIKLTTAGQHEFASGVKLEGFSALYVTEFVAPQDEEIVFKTGATGSFELLVNGNTIQQYNNWRTLPSRVPFKVEKGKKYIIEIRFAQLNNWAANLEFNFGKEVDVDYTDLLNKLKGIDVVVFAGGLSTLLEGEEMPVSYPGFKGGDRTDIELPEVQRNCLKALKAAGKKVIFVNCSGSAIGLVPETKSCDAILQAWYGGEAGGQAVADVLFGDYNPSGKLPITFYKDSSQLADFEDYSMKGRTYRYMSDPLFPFGYGLSYTSFSIGKIQVNKNRIKVGEIVELKIPVLNSGKRNGTEVVQVYIRKAGEINGPIKTLKGFQRTAVDAGKSSMVSISLPPTAFEFFDRTSGKMMIAAGEYELLYGNSSADKDLKIEKIYLE